MKIAICDDDSLDLNLLHALVKEYNASLNVSCFCKAKDLLVAFQKDFFDIVFLDIEMDAPNGYEVAQLLMQQPDKPLIVFVTISAEYTIRGYGIAFRYLSKPVSYESMAELLSIAIDLVLPQKLRIEVGGERKVVSLRDILYLEINNHVLVLHTTNDSYKFRGKLRDYEDLLPRISFAKPHNSYIVNLDKVEVTSRTALKLIDGSIIPISQRNYKTFDSALVKFIGRL